MKAQLLILKDIIKISNMGILKVINVRTIAYVISENRIVQRMLSEI